VSHAFAHAAERSDAVQATVAEDEQVDVAIAGVQLGDHRFLIFFVLVPGWMVASLEG
jgi:hypothetical protein